MIIYGSGGHGKVIAEAVLASGGKVECFLDDIHRVVGKDSL